ncbi:6-pyruvoyl trahydropterin synthase family protein [Staphylothermus hellenicus]|uniref:6-pyruvoyl tetrahydropterin synthase n=1 Tax=Staphylothermus hellenicus (strain DSM 12710 / JCM 10830 / BK20S6-10-b1 / P8) TaxID=591019 RepID=D7D9L9_STAHD|nr:6-carboxytetrahydropterin synthase [Staphylothermus hellenicus]ADI32465.1 6-pyruvoyl tetrahydropterin synthase and hypothetical protein [Staphylothermus hellenicus DSM 12710]
MRICVGVENLDFDAAHYTKGISDKCMNIHGHTFKVSVEVCGDIHQDTGMVIDFGILKNVLKKIINEYDHTIIVPKKDMDKIIIKGPFKSKIKVIDYPEATTEYIALDIAKRVKEELGLYVKVKLYEGSRNYVVVELD